MQEGKTIGQLMEEMRQKAGAQNYHGHDYMDLQRFAENTRHMIIFDVLTHDSPVGWKGFYSFQIFFLHRCDPLRINVMRPVGDLSIDPELIHVHNHIS